MLGVGSCQWHLNITVEISSPVHIGSTSSIQQNYFKSPTQIFLTQSLTWPFTAWFYSHKHCAFSYSAARDFLFSPSRNEPVLSVNTIFAWMSLWTKQGTGKHSSGLQCQAFSEAREVWQTQQQLPGCKAKTIPHISERRDNTRAGPVTVSNSSHMILWNNWTAHSRAVSLSSTAVHSYSTGFHINLVLLPEKYLFPCSVQSKNILGYNCITKWKELVAETEQHSWTSNSHSSCISPCDFSKPSVSTLNLQFMFYIFKFNRSRKITIKFSSVEHSSAGQGAIHACVHQLWTNKNTEDKNQRRLWQKRQRIPEQLAVSYGKSVYTRQGKSTGACSEFLENTGKKNRNLKVPD